MNVSFHNRRAGKALVVILIIVVALGLFIVFLPAIASKWPGPGIVESIVEGKVNGVAEVENVVLRWGGPQTIDGLVIRDARGAEIADIDLDLDTTLLRLATNRMQSYDITVTGIARGAIEEDGSNSFAKLLKTTESDTTVEPKSPSPAGAASLEGFVPVLVQLVNFSIEVTEPERELFRAVIDTANISAALGQPVDVHATGTMTRGATQGHFSFSIMANNLLGGDGSITPGGATLAMKLQSSNLPIPGIWQVKQIDEFNIAATSSNISERVDVDIAGSMQLHLGAMLDAETANASGESTHRSTLKSQFVLHRPIDRNLNLNKSAAAISGNFEARRLPTDLLTAFAPNLPINAQRDIGPVVDVTAEFGAGDRRDINATLSSQQVSANLAGRVDSTTQALDISGFEVIAHLHPLLIAERAGVMIDQPAKVRITGESLHLPGVDSSKASGRLDAERNLASARGQLKIEIIEPLRLTSASAQYIGTVRDFVMAVAVSRLEDGATLTGSAGVNSGSFSVNEHIGNLLTSAGVFNTNWDTLLPVGTIALRDLPIEDFDFVVSSLPEFARGYATGMLNAEVVTAMDSDRALAATVHLSTDKLTAAAAATQLVDRVRVESATMSAVVQPEVVRSLQSESEKPIVLLEPVPVRVALTQAIVMLKNDAGGYDLPSGPVTASVESGAPIALDNIPALIEPLELRDVSINILAPVSASPHGMYQVVASALWHTRTTDRTVGEVMLEFAMPMKKYEVESATASAAHGMQTNIRIAMEQLAVRRFERALGREENTLAKWLGGAGDLHLDITPDEATERFHGSFEADFKQLSGTFEFEFASTEKIFAITSGRAETTLTAAALNDALKMTPAEAKAAATEESASTKRAWVKSDVPAKLTIQSLRVPLTMMNGEPFDPQQVHIDMNAGLGPVVLADATGTQATMNDLTASVNANDLRKPVNVKITGNVSPASASQPGVIDLNAKLKKLLTDDNRLDSSAAIIDMTLNGKLLPLAIPDALGSYDGLLLAALGTTADAAVTADGFSKNSGNLTADLTTPTGFLKATLLGRDGTLRIKNDKPTTGELALTPEFRDRVLSKIHPIFADVRQTAQPIRATVTGAKLPIDGDVSQLDADLEITVGELEFTSGSALLTVMKLFQQSGKDSVPGRIDPIKAKVRNGVVTYDRFAVVVGKYTMNYLGTIDLNTKKVDLRTELPLEALAMTFKELEGYADKIVVPIRTHGTFGELKTEIAPDFNIAEEALKAGFKGAIQKEGGEGFGDLGKILDDLLNKNKKKESEKQPTQPK